MSRSMIAHYGHVLSGPQMPGLERVEFSAPISANVTFNDPVGGGTSDFVPAGRILHLNSSSEFETGLPAASTTVMPLLSTVDSDHPDVLNPSPNAATTLDPYVPVGPVGNVTAIPVCTGYEFQSTEFESETSLGDTYDPNDALTATNANATFATGGRITLGTLGTDHILGLVSRGPQSTLAPNAQSVLSFWGWYYPPTPA